MATKGLILALGSLFLLAGGSRISVRSQLDSSSGSGTQIGPKGETWEINTKYGCLQKWQTAGLGSEAKFVDKFCLVKVDELASTTNVQLKDISICDSSAGKMKVCPLKGEAAERRLSYSSKASVPKACFRVSDDSAERDLIEAALDGKACEEAMKLPAEQQMFLPKLTTTVTTTTTMTTTMTEEKQAKIVEDFFAEPEADIVIEAKALFTDPTKGFAWNYKDMAYKCCTSTARKPTKLQDLNAEGLPSERSFGELSGCGRMFGDTYHNGLKGYKEAAPSCPVPASLLKEITGEGYESIKSFLEGSD